ncbi:MAG: metallophosphoesterase [Actinomycetota bacterium]
MLAAGRLSVAAFVEMGPRTSPEVRVAALADLHATWGDDGLGEQLHRVADGADILVLPGDLTCLGTYEEAQSVAVAVADLDLPVVAVLGNHDHEGGQPQQVRRWLEAAEICVLEREATTLEVNGVSVGFAGTKGFGGGFVGATGSSFGETEMKQFIEHTKSCAGGLEAALLSLDTDIRIALVHYSPVRETLEGEPPELYAFLGSSLLADAVDRGGADVVFHGHAHLGKEIGTTKAGVPVRNVAATVVGATGARYRIGPGRSAERI